MFKGQVHMGKEFESNKASISAALIAAAAPYRAAAEKVLTASLRAVKVSSPRYTVKASMKNSMDGEIAFNVSCVKENWPITFEAKAVVANGKLAFTEKEVIDPMEAALKAAKEAPAPAAMPPKTMNVDLGSVVAFRNGDVVRFSSPNLPSWSLMVKASELADENIRKFVPSRVLASIRGYCLTHFRVTAAFENENFKLPMIQASVQAKPVPQMPPQWQVPVMGAQKPEGINADAMSAHAAGPIISQDPQAHNIQATKSRTMLETHLRSTAEPAALAWVRTNLKGGAPSVKNIDMSGVQYDNAHVLTGSAVFTIKFYGKMGVEEANISVPFDRYGRADIKAIQRTEADLQAEEERRAALQIKSEEEAKAAFAKFVAEEKAKADRLKTIGVKAGIGYGGSKPLPNFLIHVPKTSLPEEFSVVGKKIVVDGMIYEVEPTNYNAPDIEHCTFWALRLKPELGIKDADYVPNYSGVSAMLATARK